MQDEGLHLEHMHALNIRTQNSVLHLTKLACNLTAVSSDAVELSIKFQASFSPSCILTQKQ